MSDRDGKTAMSNKIEESTVVPIGTAAVAVAAEEVVATTTSTDAASKINSADEAASLLDSCESEDDEEECDSIVACGSQDYSQFMDETGRHRHAEDKDVVAAVGGTEMPGNDVMGTGTPATDGLKLLNDEKVCATTSPLSPTSVTSPLPSEAVVHTSSPPPAKRRAAKPIQLPALVPPPPRTAGPNIRPQDMTFDLNQPWERSLLRQLEKVAEGSSTKTQGEQASVSPNKQERPNSASPPRRRELLLLGHTESRDYAMDFDDSVSLDTNASSTVPTKAQLIHRTILNTTPQPRVVYHVAGGGEHEDNYYDVKQHGKPFIHHQQPHQRGHHDQSETSSLTSLTLQTDDDRDEVSFPAKTLLKIPDRLPGGSRKGEYGMTPLEEHYFLEMEASQNGDESYDEYAKDLAASAANTILPDPGCFCLGINMLDYVLPPASSSKPSNDHGGAKGTVGRTRLKGVMRPSRLALVQEEEEVPVLPEIIDLRRIKVIHHTNPHLHRPPQPEQPRSRQRHRKGDLSDASSGTTPVNSPRTPKSRRHVVDV